MKFDNTNKYAVHFGSGNIGRGFIGKILSESGYHVIFIDIQQDIIEALHKEKSYEVEILHPSPINGQSITLEKVSNVDGIMSAPENTDAINQAIAHAEIITTAVGVSILKIVASTIAQGLTYRHEHKISNPLNIIACENQIHASTILKDHVLAIIPDADVLTNIGFPCCSVDRIVVPQSTPQSNVLSVRVEEFFEWNIDLNAYVGDIPNIPSAGFIKNLDAYIERKLYILNTGHTIISYLGHIYKHRTIDEAIANPEILKIAYAGMYESAMALVEKWNFEEAELISYIEKILNRFRNELLEDSVYRVGREPLRKIAPNDRLLMPFNTCKKYKLPCDNLAIGIAAALLFFHESDKSAVELHTLISNKGPKYVLENVCKLNDEVDIQKIFMYYNILKEKI